MSLVLPEILVELRALSPGLLVAGVAVALVLWLGGWWSYRFWVVLGTTVAAGVLGLYEAPALRMQPVLASVLLAVAAGMLALSLARLFAFAAGGVTCLVLVHLLIPSAHAPVICFLAGGLLATLLYRLWLILLTSFAGSLLLLHCGLALATQAGGVDLVAWCRSQAVLLNWVCGIATALGWVVQFFWTRRRSARPKQEHDAAEPEEPPKPAPPPPRPKKQNKVRLRIPIPFRKAA